MKTLVVGYGEVGRAHFNILSKAYPGDVYYKDKDEQIFDSQDRHWFPNGKSFDLMLVAMQCDPKNMQPFIDAVVAYDKQFGPAIIDVLTTTPCGTIERIQEDIVAEVNKSSVRGMHPHLDKFLLDIPKHIGGPSTPELRAYYEGAGITCVTHKKARTVEICHILNNFTYGVNIMAADECAKYCREYGVDYMEFLKYRESNNAGFIKSGFPSKVSPILYPSGGNIGGHCVKYAPTTIPDNIKGPLAKMLQDHK